MQVADAPKQVVVMERNQLAAERLAELLRADNPFQLTLCNDIDRLLCGVATPHVFVIDGDEFALGQLMLRLSCAYPHSKFIVVCSDLSLIHAESLIVMGVHGLLTFASVSDHLVPAIERTLAGGLFIPEPLLQEYVLAARERRKSSLQARDRMTVRESHVLELKRRRLSNKEIAEALGIREATVKFHLSNIYSKFGVGCRRALLDLLGTDPIPVDTVTHWPRPFMARSAARAQEMVARPK
jgi:DNA-binding NarL/FixJ family response regulator